MQHAAQPGRARLLVHMFDRPAGMADLIGTHRRVADEDHLIVMPIFVQYVPGRRPFRKAAAVVLPYALVQAVVEVEEFHVRSEEHTSELQSLMRISYAVFCLKKKTTNKK